MGIIDYVNFMAGKDLLAASPNLLKVKDNVAAVPSVKKYLEVRSVNHIA